MKKIAFFALFLFVIFAQSFAQDCYWVLFKDKNTSFDPYQYFDAKAIERYKLANANLYDITNYPVNDNYVSVVECLSQEIVGTSRWLNAAGIVASQSQIESIRNLDFVKEIYLVDNEAVLTETDNFDAEIDAQITNSVIEQVKIHKGEMFKENNITGKGVRIAVFDGGFKDVDTHPAFKHLRDKNRIIKTWNFVKNNEDVYLGHSHGRMVLSCIAGIEDDTVMLGMAPDAEFLLARTEIMPEKKKEEIWWVQALEWADKNGADIVNSSLGYGKQRYNLKDMDGKTSIVAKAANTAARKGILVCNSMGNEGNDSDWEMLITPADADSILSVGAVSSLNTLSYFSSFGPTADGRMKPNVVAMGNCEVAQSNGNFGYAQGTSFSSPMVAGFAACVKQLHPEYSAWQLKAEIEKSGNHYPYFDYAFGYGVPQADYFFYKSQKRFDVFSVSEDLNKIYITLNADTNYTYLFYKIVNGDGTIEKYDNVFIDKYIKHKHLYKSDLQKNQTLEFWCNGQYLAFKPSFDENLSRNEELNELSFIINANIITPDNDVYNRPFKIKFKSSFVLNFSFMMPSMWSFDSNVWNSKRLSHSVTFDFDENWQIRKHYGLGFRVGFGSSWYAVSDDFQPHTPSVTNYTLKKNNLKVTKFDLEIYQRFFLANAGNQHWYLDTGIFGEWNVGFKYKQVVKYDENGHNAKETFVQRKYVSGLGKINNVDCGVRLRVGITRAFAIYGQYRITNILKVKNFVPIPNAIPDLPKWEIGIQLF